DVSSGGFLVADRDATKLLETVDAALDEIASCRREGLDSPAFRTSHPTRPACSSAVKPTKTEFQLPYRSGISRQGAPVRSTQRIPLTVHRLSAMARTAFAAIRKRGVENALFRVVRSPRLNAASLRKAALNQNSIPLSKTVNTIRRPALRGTSA